MAAVHGETAGWLMAAVHSCTAGWLMLSWLSCDFQNVPLNYSKSKLTTF